MNIKSLMTTSVVALISASAAQAADVVIPHETAPAVITAPSFSWTGFYIGGQIGNLSSKMNIFDSETKDKWEKADTPKISGFMGGIYAGSNINLGSGLILGVETDAVWADRDDTKTGSIKNLDEEELRFLTSALTKANAKFTGISKVGEITENDKAIYTNTFKEKWSGATRVRLGFAATDRIMPYVAGGVAYAQLHRDISVKVTRGKAPEGSVSTDTGASAQGPEVGAEIATAQLYDKSKTFVGFTIGGGIDFAMTDNVLLRAEYRYSDFGKKAFEKGANKISYKTNDFRVGVAYKF